VAGNAAMALHLIDTLLAQEPNEPPAIQSWAHGLLADASKYLGQNPRADAEFKRALALAPGDNFLLADYADFLIDRGRAREALDLVKDYSQSDTSFLRQVLAESALGLPAARADTATMASRFSDLEQRGDSSLYGREEARFALHLQHDAARSLRLAQANWRIQRAPEDMRIYLEAALAAGQPAAAQPVVDFVRGTGFEDPTVRGLVARVTRAIDMPAKAGRSP
jgi:Tfp pilus assembly protein PilF